MHTYIIWLKVNEMLCVIKRCMLDLFLFSEMHLRSPRTFEYSRAAHLLFWGLPQLDPMLAGSIGLPLLPTLLHHYGEQG